MPDWHWVQTHLISGNADNAGRVILNDVLGAWKHTIHVFSDSSRQTPLTIHNACAYDNGRQIMVTKLYYPSKLILLPCYFTDLHAMQESPRLQHPAGQPEPEPR